MVLWYYHIQLQDTNTLARRSGFVEQMIRGAIMIKLHPNNSSNNNSMTTSKNDSS